MGTDTPNHAFYKPDPGENGWDTAKNADWDDLDTRLILKDTAANRPAAGTEGRWFLATDTLDLSYDDGAAWQDILGSVDAATLDGESPSYYLDHANLSNVGEADHHAPYTNADAVSAVNAETSLSVDISGDADTVDGNHASAFASSGHDHAHGDLTGVSADDHHAKTTSASDLTDVSADSVSDAHHAKTQPSDIDSSNWNDVEIQHNGTDGQGIFNVKTQ